MSLNNLAALYRAQGRYSEAEPLYQRALTIQEQRLGLDHPNVVVTLRNYIALLKVMHRDAEAAQMERRVIAIQAGNSMGSQPTS